jgi:hypothetical protein
MPNVLTPGFLQRLDLRVLEWRYAMFEEPAAAQTIGEHDGNFSRMRTPPLKPEVQAGQWDAEAQIGKKELTIVAMSPELLASGAMSARDAASGDWVTRRIDREHAIASLTENEFAILETSEPDPDDPDKQVKVIFASRHPEVVQGFRDFAADPAHAGASTFICERPECRPLIGSHDEL